MKKIIYSLAAAAAITGAAGTAAHAQEVQVQKGDSLWALAHEYKVSIEDLKSWNGLSSEMIHPNDILNVSDHQIYKVQPGDTIWSIAEQFGANVMQIKKWNSIKGDMIYPNDEIKIKNAPVKPQKAKAVQKQPNQAAAKPAQAPEQKPVQAPEQKKEVKTADTKPAPSVQSEKAAKTLSVKATGYTADCKGCSGITATGVDLKANPDVKVVSVDPDVIPLGSKLYVEGYGYAVAADTGGAIKGNRVDLYFKNEQTALNWGVKQVKVKVLD